MNTFKHLFARFSPPEKVSIIQSFFLDFDPFLFLRLESRFCAHFDSGHKTVLLLEICKVGNLLLDGFWIKFVLDKISAIFITLTFNVVDKIERLAHHGVE